MSYGMAIDISSRWWARPNAAQARTKRGTKPQGAFVRMSPAFETLITRSGEPVIDSCVERNHRRSSTLAATVPVASMAAGRRAVPAGIPGLYRSRDVRPPLCGPASVPGRIPRVAHGPAGCANVTVHVHVRDT
jgi:hypothetical protein